MILHTIDLLDKLNIVQKIVVVGFAKKSVINILKGRVIFAEQKKQLGTADAVACAIKYLSKDAKDVLILNGDDSAFYKEKSIKNLFKKHNEEKSSLTFLTTELDNPTGIGRVVRNNSGKVVAIVEEKDASLEQKRINEVNPACYIFEVSFLKNYLSKIKKSNITHEYYLTNLVDLAFKNNEKIETVMEKNLVWRGINTEDELREANRLFLQAK
jgi:bifunctional N-acetylglucosamine-1-phosphate-uridyltransferase/glucosamine-1-phosphate-acetyltransferase GlmU-like protein